MRPPRPGVPGALSRRSPARVPSQRGKLMLRHHPLASHPSPRAPRTLAATLTAIALASGTLAACADRGPTAPSRAPSLTGTLSTAARQTGKPTREGIPDLAYEFT